MAYLVPRTDLGGASASHVHCVPDNDTELYRSAVEFGDVERILLADPQSAGFGLVARDESCGISVHSRAVPDCPMHLMRAEATLPFSPAEFLMCVSPPFRQHWDEHIIELRPIRILPPPPPLNAKSESQAQAETQGTQEYSGIVDVPLGQWLRPGERRVALQYMAIRSPIPFVQKRDFEMVLAEGVRPDGTAWAKAFSTPIGYAEPCDARQSRYVRALLLLSGILAQPVAGGGCRMIYIALVHPMGLLPAFVVNMVINAQLTSLRKLMNFKMPYPTEEAENAKRETEDIKYKITDKDVSAVRKKSQGVELPRVRVIRDASVTGTTRKRQKKGISAVRGVIKKLRSRL